MTPLLSIHLLESRINLFLHVGKVTCRAFYVYLTHTPFSPPPQLIFSSPSKTRTIMELEIAMENPKPEYIPGDRVEGTVLLSPKTNVRASSIRVDFTGKAKAVLKFDKKQHYMSKAILFHYTKLLFVGNHTFPTGRRFEWPFAFTFPGTPQRLCENGRFEKTGCWLYDSEWPLPPSLSFDNVSIRGTFKCDIQYKIKVQLIRPECSLRFGNLCRKTILNFSPTRDEENPSIIASPQKDIWQVQSLRILPEYQCRSLTVKEKVHSFFRSDLPISAFQVTTSLPNKLLQGARIPILVQVKHLPEQSTSMNVPAVYLREVSVSTTISTHGRASNGFSWSHMDFREKHRFFQRKDLSVFLYDANSESEGTSLDLGELFNIRCDTPLDFQCYNVSRNHVLKLRIVIQCADKRHEMRHTVPGFRVLSRFYSHTPALVPAGDDMAHPVPYSPTCLSDESIHDDPPPVYRA
ncbi:hypothetical protein VTO42DRAFT_5223 [Malbranchea cinnamomea]